MSINVQCTISSNERDWVDWPCCACVTFSPPSPHPLLTLTSFLGPHPLKWYSKQQPGVNKATSLHHSPTPSPPHPPSLSHLLPSPPSITPPPLPTFVPYHGCGQVFSDLLHKVWEPIVEDSTRPRLTEITAVTNERPEHDKSGRCTIKP